MRDFTIEDIGILYEDNHILVAVKPQNMPSQADETGDSDMLSVLKAYIKERDNKPGEAYLGLVHRLDRVTGGIMVFAKTSKSASRLSAMFANREVTKKYYAVVLGRMNTRTGTLVNYLKKHSATNKVYVATSATTGAKRAELDYKVLEDLGLISLVEIQLATGRSHQIRVQFSACGNPVFGDVKYGGDKLAKGHNLALWAVMLEFKHPVTGANMIFVSYPTENIEPWKKFDLSKYLDVFKGEVILPVIPEEVPQKTRRLSRVKAVPESVSVDDSDDDELDIFGNEGADSDGSDETKASDGDEFVLTVDDE